MTSGPGQCRPAGTAASLSGDRPARCWGTGDRWQRDRKDGTNTAHVGRQWLGRYGKTDSGVVTVTRCGPTNAFTIRCTRCRIPRPGILRRGKNDPGVPDQPGDRRGPGGAGAGGGVRVPGGRRGLRLPGPGRVPRRVGRGRAAVRDGPQATPRDLGPRHGCARPVDAARALAWIGPEDPGDRQAVTRIFSDGHTETWWAADARLGWWARTMPGAWW